MTRIGAAWIKKKESDAGNVEYGYSLLFDEAIMPFQIDKIKRFVMVENKNKKDNEKAPDFYIEVFIPKEKEKTTDEGVHQTL